MGTGILLLLLVAIFGGKKNGNGNGNGEPDEKPGPIDRPTWLDRVDALVWDEPRPGGFYKIRPGDTASGIAGRALMANNTGSNRVALIKCMTRALWNDELYASNRHPQSWGTMFDVDGENLSAAFLPRHASAVQFMAERRMPPRTILPDGGYDGEGPTGSFGLLWIPVFLSSKDAVACEGTDVPPWLRAGLSGG